MANPYKPLEKSIGYRFRRRRHLETALTHRSHRFERPDVGVDNQRMEFLGDAALSLVAAAYFYERFPDFEEGHLTRLRSSVSATESLAAIAREIGLGAYVRLGRGEQLSGGAERPTLLEDSLEAVIGAAYVDGGLKAVKKIFRRLFEPRVSEVPRLHRNPKGDLQELCQRRWKHNPRYRVVREEGPAHQRRYVVEVRAGERLLATGEGASKREAESAAADAALAQVGDG
jgi:ribonuclease-3